MKTKFNKGDLVYPWNQSHRIYEIVDEKIWMNDFYGNGRDVPVIAVYFKDGACLSSMPVNILTKIEKDKQLMLFE